jgi:3-oxoacyl-[acyl-carrier-protein] synthase II
MKFSSAATLVVFVAQASAFSTFQSNVKTSSTQLYAEKPRVVVTGLGVVNGCGVGHEDFWKNVVEGKSSIDTVKRFDASAMPCTIASEVPDDMFDPKDYFNNFKNVKSNDRYTHFAVAAARQALKDAGVGDTPETLENPSRIGVMVGSAFGGMETFEQETVKLNKNLARPKVRIYELYIYIC